MPENFEERAMASSTSGAIFRRKQDHNSPCHSGGINQMTMTVDSTEFEVTAAACDDLDLVHASKNGNVAAFEQLVIRYDRKLLRIAQNVTHNREDAEDAVQEAFLKAFQHLEEFRENSKFSTWLIRITVNQALTKLRKQRVTREVSLDAGFQVDEDMLPWEVIDWAPNPEQLYGTSQLREILISGLRELPPTLRTVFVLRDVEGLSIIQTAEVLNLSHTAVKSRLLRARLQLRERLNRYFAKQSKSAQEELVPYQSADRSDSRAFVECLGH